MKPNILQILSPGAKYFPFLRFKKYGKVLVYKGTLLLRRDTKRLEKDLVSDLERLADSLWSSQGAHMWESRLTSRFYAYQRSYVKKICKMTGTKLPSKTYGGVGT